MSIEEKQWVLLGKKKLLIKTSKTKFLKNGEKIYKHNIKYHNLLILNFFPPIIKIRNRKHKLVLLNLEKSLTLENKLNSMFL